MLKYLILHISILLISMLYPWNCVHAQVTDSTDASADTLNRSRFILVTATGATLYAVSIPALYVLWYKDYPQSGFHFFNDNDEWLQMDKAGHTTASYYLGLIGYSSLRWAGVNEKKAT